MDDMTRVPMSAGELVALASKAGTSRPCSACGPLLCPGWESMPGGFDRSSLIRVGSLRDPGLAAPTLEEFHPQSTHRWSAEAPISLGHHPYNLCEVWQCGSCSRVYLRYTEYGGYYEDERIRLVAAERVVATDA
jgi:hypothetical protein